MGDDMRATRPWRRGLAKEATAPQRLRGGERYLPLLRQADELWRETQAAAGCTRLVAPWAAVHGR